MATSAEEARDLESHVEELAGADVKAEFLTASELREAEPSLAVGHEGGAAFVPSDSQIDAALAVDLVCHVGLTSSFCVKVGCCLLAHQRICTRPSLTSSQPCYKENTV